MMTSEKAKDALIPDGPFVAIDFETADWGRDSACSVGVIRVEGMEIVRRATRLIRPPRPSFYFTHIHGIHWGHVKDQPPFADVWRDLSPLLDGVKYLAAHNAMFDRGVLHTCCARAGLPIPPQAFVCTMTLARRAWKLRPTKLTDVCRYLHLALKHHDAGSDAEACARIVLAAKQAVPPPAAA